MTHELPSIFSGLDRQSVDEAMAQFERIEVGANTVVIQEGEYDPTVAIIDRGEVAITRGDVILGRAGSGDLIGEMALFGSGERTATVVSTGPTSLLVLRVEGYQNLCAMSSPVATAIEEHALHALTDRLREVGDRIGALSKGEDEEAATPAPGFFDRVATAFGSGGIVFPGLMNKTAVLERSKLFHGFSEEALAATAEHFYPMGARRGHFLCTEGESGEDMFILASGEVDVVLAVGGHKVERLATLGPGDAFGMCSLLQPENSRMASVIARTKVTALSMGMLTFAGLVPRNDVAGSVLRVAMIRAMADQLAYANNQLATLDAQRQRELRTAKEVEAVMRAAAALESYGDYLGGEGQTMPYLVE